MTVINEGYDEYRLDNGLVVATQRTPTRTVAARIRVNYGSSHEREGEEGLAHYLEHCLVTGGSQRYSPTAADEARGLFGRSNAFTNIARTIYVGQMLNEDLESWIDYTSDHLLRPRFDPERINGERERVLREISDAKSSPAYNSEKEFSRIFYGDHPKGRFSLGKEAVVRNANQEVMRRFHGRGYNPNNMDLIMVGGLPDNIEEIIENYFGQAPRGENTRKEFPRLEPLTEKMVLRRPAPERFNEDNPKESSAQIFLQYRGPVKGEEDEYTIRAMNQLLGGDSNSLLFQKVGLEKGLAYQTETTADANYNAGEMGIYASVPAGRIDESIDALFEEIERIKTQPTSGKSIERIRKMAKFSLASTLESNEGHVSAIEMKLDEGLTPESYIDGFNSVTLEKVREAANKYLPDKENGKYVLYIRDPLQE